MCTLKFVESRCHFQLESHQQEWGTCERHVRAALIIVDVIFEMLSIHFLRNVDRRFHAERYRGNRRLPVCAVVVVQGGLIGRQNAGGGCVTFA